MILSLSRRLAVLLVCLPALLGLTAPSSEQPASTIRQDPGARAWVGRYQEIEEYLRTAECVNMQPMASNSSPTRCTLPPGGLVARMAWKPQPPGVYRGFWESYKSEIAAYELDKLLKMDMVPPAVERELQGNKGYAVLWVENIVQLKADTSPPGSKRADWDRQMARASMFDNLIGNADRNLNNVLVDAAWNLILLDHTRAFRSSIELPRPLNRIDGAYWDRVQGLTRQELDAALGQWLDESQITAILDRREKMRAETNRLVSEKGSAAVVLR